MQARFYHDGVWSEEQPKLLGPLDHAFWMSSIVFDGARSIGGLVPDLEPHCERLIRSAEIMQLKPTLTAAEIAALCREGVRMMPRELDLYIRPAFYALDGFIMPEADSTQFALVLFEAPVPPDGPFKVCMSSHRRPARDMAPTMAKASCLYPNSALALRQAVDKGFDNAIALDPNGNVAEFLSANLWIVKDGVALTPAVNGTFLNGVTRQRIIQLLGDDGVAVRETTLTVDDLYTADEIFATGNHAKVRAVTTFEDRNLQPGPIARKAKDLYMDWAQGFSVF